MRIGCCRDNYHDIHTCNYETFNSGISSGTIGNTELSKIELYSIMSYVVYVLYRYPYYATGRNDLFFIVLIESASLNF